MAEQCRTLVILTPAFASDDERAWLPSQANFVRTINRQFPELAVVILAFHFPKTTKPYRWFGNEIIPFNGQMQGGVRTLLLWLRVWRRLRSIRKQRHVLGLFSFFCSESAFIGHYFAKRFGLKHFIWILGQDAAKENKQIKRIRPESEELIAISDFLVREFENNHGIRPAHIIPIGIVPEDFPIIQSPRSIDIIGVGSLSAIKRYDLFIEVIKRVSKEIPDLKVVICGGGGEQQRLQEMINRERLSDTISLIGERSHAEVLQLMQQSKVLLHTSAYEGFGMVCAEALYAGAHVISFCKPMDIPIERWNIAHDPDEMVSMCIKCLQTRQPEYVRVLPYKMNNTVREILKCFGYTTVSDKAAD